MTSRTSLTDCSCFQADADEEHRSSGRNRGKSIHAILSDTEWRDGPGTQARKSLNSDQHWQHACTRVRNSAKPSIEDPHNSMHGGLGGVMASYQSSFHPVFWLHHNNVDRFYEKYCELQFKCQLFRNFLLKMQK